MAISIPVSTIITVNEKIETKSAVIEHTSDIVKSDDPVLISEIQNNTVLKITDLLETELAEEIADNIQELESEIFNTPITKKNNLPPRNLTVNAISTNDNKTTFITQTINNSIIQSKQETAPVFPGGEQFSVQYNKNSQFTGSGNLTFDPLSSLLDIVGNLESEIITTENITNISGNINIANNGVTLEENYFRNENLNFPSTDGSSGQIFLTNGSGTISWGTPESTFQNSITLVNSTGIVNHDCSLSYIFIHNSIVDNFVVNLTNLNLGIGKSINILVILNQGAVAYYIPGLRIAGTLQTIKWVNGDLPFVTALKTDVYSFTILNIAGNYTVLGQMINFG